MYVSFPISVSGALLIFEKGETHLVYSSITHAGVQSMLM